MNILALDAAFGEASACLIAGGRIWAATGHEGKPHSQALIPLLEGLLRQGGCSWPELEMLALGIGPGSFTGVRVAAATMAGLNSAMKLPMLPLSSLAVTALQCDIDEPLRVIEDARADEAFVGCYRKGESLQEDRCMAWADVVALPPALFCALSEPAVPLSGWQRVAPALPREQALALAVEAAVAATDPAELPAVLQPAYLQQSTAERSLNRA